MADRATAAVLQICLSGKAMGVTLLVLANTQMPLNILAVFCRAEHICNNSMLQNFYILRGIHFCLEIGYFEKHYFEI